MSTVPNVWCLLDGRPGNKGQVLGVAEALGHPYTIKEVHYNKTARLPNLVRGTWLLGISAEEKQQFQAPWPDLVIAAGRRLAPLARWIKAQAARDGHTVRLCHLMWPEVGINAFDLIAVPQHDERVLRPNMMETLGAPHMLTKAKLWNARRDKAYLFLDLPQPRITVLVGGSSRHQAVTRQEMTTLGLRLASFARQTNGSILVTTSRRTGAEQTQALMKGLADVPHFAYLWGDGGENPFMGMLGCADAVVVTEDSVSMLSEATVTEKPVYLYSFSDGVSPFANFHKAYSAHGAVKPFDGQWHEWDYTPVLAAQQIASELSKRFDFALSGPPKLLTHQ